MSQKIRYDYSEYFENNKIRFLIEFFGEYGCFTNCALKADRTTYDIPTYSALTGMLRSIYWHPGCEWHISKLYVLNPIEKTSIKRNERKNKYPGSKYVSAYLNGKPMPRFRYGENRTLVNTTMLYKPHYVIEAYMIADPTVCVSAKNPQKKINSIIARRLLKHQAYYVPYFGCREFHADFKLWPKAKPITTIPEDRYYTNMFHAFDYSENPNMPKAIFTNVEMKQGIIDYESETHTHANISNQNTAQQRRY